jgi:hypothetical protein
MGITMAMNIIAGVVALEYGYSQYFDKRQKTALK